MLFLPVVERESFLVTWCQSDTSSRRLAVIFADMTRFFPSSRYANKMASVSYLREREY